MVPRTSSLLLRRLPLRVPALAIGVLLTTAPASALADIERVGAFLDAFASLGNVDRHTLHIPPVMTEPDPLKNRDLLLDGPGRFIGGGLHLVIAGTEARGGFGVGLFGMDGMSLRTDALPEGLSASLGMTWGAYIEAFVGRELAKGPVLPYFDLRAVFSMMLPGVQLRHAVYGVLGETQYNAYGFGIGPRLGVSIPLSDPFVIDVSGYYGLFGAERATVVASFGFWVH